MAQKISKNFSQVGDNIKKIRQAKKISQAEFAQLFNLARPSVGAYEEGRSEPKIDTLIQIAQYFNISIDVLLTRKLTISEIYSFNQLNKTLDKVHNKKGSPAKKVHTAVIVSADQSLEYVVNHAKKDFIATLDEVIYPGHETRDIRVFEHQGVEMQYNNQGLHPQDLLAGTKVKDLTDEQLTGEVLIIVTSEGIKTRRCTEVKKDELILATDNPSFGEEELSTSEILELWKVIGKYTTHLHAPSRLEERVAKIESLIERLGDKLD